VRGRLAYVLPLRWTDDAGLAELTAYLRWLRVRADVTVVDGSPPTVFAAHAAAWDGLVGHLRPDADLTFVNGKVNGVITGLRHPGSEHVVIADDDVRYDDRALAAIDRLLDDFDLVRPQNYFAPLPWHARWDTARTLLNRSVGVDYPGTFGIRRSTFARMGGYDGAVLFENLEMVRTARVHGGLEHHAHDVYVRRIPPDSSQFWQQRVRQAYDELAQPARLVTFLAVWPAVLTTLATRRRRELVTGVGLVIAFAEVGRRRGGGRSFFPASSTLLAPIWLAERATCVWVALVLRVTGRGVSYGGRRILVAAHSERSLRALVRRQSASS